MLVGIIIILFGLIGFFIIDVVMYFVCFVFVLFILKFKLYIDGFLKDVNIKFIY